MTIKIIANDKGSPPGKLADAELHFDATIRCEECRGEGSVMIGGEGPLSDAYGICANCEGTGRLGNPDPLAGLKLIGFAIWESRLGTRPRNVTFPARQYSVNGERRSIALLRPILDADGQERIRALILQAYAEHEAEAEGTL
jgi:hypothetical protein